MSGVESTLPQAADESSLDRRAAAAPVPLDSAPTATRSVVLEERVYTAESEFRHPLRLIRQIVQDTWSSRELSWRMFVRDLSSQYRQSALGYLWAVLPPLGTMLIWVFLNRQGIIQVGETSLPYPLFVLIGIVLWDAFAAALLAPMNAVTASAALMARINFPREAIMLTAFASLAFHVAIRLVLLALLFAYYGLVPPPAALLAPIGMLALISLGFGIGLLLTPPSILYHDVSRTVNFVLGPMFFLTPIIYPSPTAWPATILNRVNPVSPLLSGTRHLLGTGLLPNPTPFLLLTVVSFIGLALAWVVCRTAMPHLISKMGA